MAKSYAPLSEDPDFTRWYAVYPKKVNKGDAKKAWEQTREIRPPTDRMIKALIVQRASSAWREDGGKWIPYPASYLRGERWDDATEVEIDSVRDGKAWHESASGIEAKALELGLSWRSGETFMQFARRVKDAFYGQNVVEIDRKLAAAGGDR